MSDPLALLPLALAAGGGRLNRIDASRAVAAGFTLLQRCAPLVRALAGKRAAAVLPADPAFLCALAASDGRGLFWCDPHVSPDELGSRSAACDVGAVFTMETFTATCRLALGADIPLVLLDDAPAHAVVHAGDRRIVVDLGSHFGLPLEGQRDAEGRDEECLLIGERILTHRDLLRDARAFGATAGLTPVDRTMTVMPTADVDLFVAGVVAPLLYGGEVFVTPTEDRAPIDQFAPTRLVH